MHNIGLETPEQRDIRIRTRLDEHLRKKHEMPLSELLTKPEIARLARAGIDVRFGGRKSSQSTDVKHVLGHLLRDRVEDYGYNFYSAHCGAPTKEII